jgi:hypothetical protein
LHSEITAPDTSDAASVALALQLEEEALHVNSHSLDGFGGDDATAASVALAMQMEEESQQICDPVMLAAQFAQYDSELHLADAESSFQNGEHGDLMAQRIARETLTLETMETTTLYSIGHGQMQEKLFFELLSLNSVRVLYDLRPTDYRQELHGVSNFSVTVIKAGCKSRGIFYKQMPIGREGAYGTLAHLRSDEAKHVLIELLWQAKRRRTAFLGRDEAWQQDPRLAIADLLTSHGHTVQHITSVGSCEKHERLQNMPTWLTTEEERLRKLEKQRKAGELKWSDKSSVSRSTEAVAMTLTQQKEELDVGKELQNAENQTQLKFTQQRVARLQRVANEEGALAKGKALTNVPKFINDEAVAQAAYTAQRKKEKQAQKQAPAAEALDGGGATTSTEAGSEEILVQCVKCEASHPWSALVERDGVCDACTDDKSPAEDGADDTEPIVECLACKQEQPWSLLQLGDGLCPSCFDADRLGNVSGFSAASDGDGHSELVSSLETSSSVASTAAASDAPTTAASRTSGGSGWRSRRGKVSLGIGHE